LPRKGPVSRPFSAAEPASRRSAARSGETGGGGGRAPAGAGFVPGGTGPYKTAADFTRRAGRTLGKRKGHYLLTARPAFGGRHVFTAVVGGAFTGRRFGRRGARLFFDGNCFGRGFPFSVSVSGGDYDLRLSLFYRLLLRGGGRGRGFLFYNDYFFDGARRRNRFFLPDILIVFLPLNEFHLGFLDVI
jgi:hypothetical protein